jgi:hypothetical protein
MLLERTGATVMKGSWRGQVIETGVSFMFTLDFNEFKQILNRRTAEQKQIDKAEKARLKAMEKEQKKRIEAMEEMHKD